MSDSSDMGHQPWMHETAVKYPECIEKQLDVEKQRDAWRAACRYLYEVIGEGGSKGRPLDLITKGDYGRIIAMIGKAEALEEDVTTDYSD